MAKEVHATTNDVKVTKRVITAPPSPQTVRIYSKEDGSHKDVFPVDAKEIVAQGEYTMEPVEAVLPTVGENVYKPVRPETLSAIHPEATTPLDTVHAPTLAEDDDEPGATLRGPLPDDFPSRSSLEAAGFGTYAKLRKQVAKGEGWWKDVSGVGEKHSKSVEDALKEK
jgi:hypothetical protein